jgi:hypothetical protein
MHLSSPEPNCHEDLEHHLLGRQGIQEGRTGSSSPDEDLAKALKKDPAVKDHQMLDCIYVYKFDKHGRLTECKARLMVRGDQQSKSMTPKHPKTSMKLPAEIAITPDSSYFRSI